MAEKFSRSQPFSLPSRPGTKTLLRHYFYFTYFNEQHTICLKKNLQLHGFISREGIKDLHFSSSSLTSSTDFPQLCKLSLSYFFLFFFLLLFFVCVCFEIISRDFSSLSLLSLSFPLSGGTVSMHGMQLGSLRDPSLSISFLLRGGLYAPIGTR